MSLKIKLTNGNKHVISHFRNTIWCEVYDKDGNFAGIAVPENDIGIKAASGYWLLKNITPDEYARLVQICCGRSELGDDPDEKDKISSGIEAIPCDSNPYG